MDSDSEWERFERMNPLIGFSALGQMARVDRAHERACRVINDMPESVTHFRGVRVDRFDHAQLVKLVGYLAHQLSEQWRSVGE